MTNFMHYSHILFYICAHLGIHFPIGKVVGDYVTSPVTEDDYEREAFYYMNDRCIEDSAVDIPMLDQTTQSLFVFRPVSVSGLPIYQLFRWAEHDGKFYWQHVISVKEASSDNNYSRSFWLSKLLREPDNDLDAFYLQLLAYSCLKHPEKHPEERFAQMILTENGSKVDFF